jgi:hypothetical protein
MTVARRWPERYACIAAITSAGLRPISRATGVSTDFDVGWQLEQDEAPGGASLAAAGTNSKATIANALHSHFMCAPLGTKGAAAVAPLLVDHADRRSVFFSGNDRRRLPVAAKIALSTAGAATAIVGSPMPPQNPPEGMTITSTLGISAMRITL